jgi:hypothetical protein
MERIKSQVEAQIQEIIFFGSLILAFSMFLSGIFYLALSPETLVFILGQFGATIAHGLFSFFGYGFFYFTVMALHMGYVTNFHVFNFRDFKREYPVLMYSAFAHLLILSLFSTLLTVFQVYLEIPSSPALTHGAGGMMGALFGPHFYSALGIYGSFLLLIALKIATAIATGFFEIPDMVIAMKSASRTTARVSVKGAKRLNSSLINGAQFFLKGGEFSEAAAMSSRGISRSLNRANHIFTEHFHIYRDDSAQEEQKKDVKTEKKDKKDAKEAVKLDAKPAAKKAKVTGAMASQSEKLMNSLKELKKMATLRKPSLEKVAVKAVKPVEKAGKKKTPAVKAKAKKK